MSGLPRAAVRLRRLHALRLPVPRARRTIRLRLTLWYVALLAIILIGFSTFLYVRLAHNLRDGTDRALTLDAERVLSVLDVQNGKLVLGDAANQIPADMLVVLYDPSGRRLDASVPRLALPALPAPLSAAGVDAPGPVTVRLGQEDWRVLTRPVADQGQEVGILQVAQSEQQAEAALRQLALLMGFAIPLTLLLAVAGGMFLAGRALDPIDRITRAAQRIGAADLSQRLAFPASPDEIGRLAATFDQMLGRLDGAFARQRQFTADASHELRTPLALLISQVELALDRNRQPAAYRQALTAVRDEAQRMMRLLAALLTLARADDGNDALREAVPFDELVDDVVVALSPLAEAGGVQLATDTIVPSVVLGDQTQLVQLLVNLVENAVKYTPPGGHVWVSLRHLDRWATFTVTDSGIGIASEHLPHLFERFYRVDPARSRAQESAGLGLAIAQSTAQAHRGDIAVASASGVGTTFTLRLPLVQLGPPPR